MRIWVGFRLAFLSAMLAFAGAETSARAANGPLDEFLSQQGVLSIKPLVVGAFASECRGKHLPSFTVESGSLRKDLSCKQLAKFIADDELAQQQSGSNATPASGLRLQFAGGSPTTPLNDGDYLIKINCLNSDLYKALDNAPFAAWSGTSGRNWWRIPLTEQYGAFVLSAFYLAGDSGALTAGAATATPVPIPIFSHIAGLTNNSAVSAAEQTESAILTSIGADTFHDCKTTTRSFTFSSANKNPAQLSLALFIATAQKKSKLFDFLETLAGTVIRVATGQVDSTSKPQQIQQFDRYVDQIVTLVNAGSTAAPPMRFALNLDKAFAPIRITLNGRPLFEIAIERAQSPFVDGVTRAFNLEHHQYSADRMFRVLQPVPAATGDLASLQDDLIKKLPTADLLDTGIANTCALKVPNVLGALTTLSAATADELALAKLIFLKQLQHIAPSIKDTTIAFCMGQEAAQRVNASDLAKQIGVSIDWDGYLALRGPLENARNHAFSDLWASTDAADNNVQARHVRFYQSSVARLEAADRNRLSTELAQLDPAANSFATNCGTVRTDVLSLSPHAVSAVMEGWNKALWLDGLLRYARENLMTAAQAAKMDEWAIYQCMGPDFVGYLLSPLDGTVGPFYHQTFAQVRDAALKTSTGADRDKVFNDVIATFLEGRIRPEFEGAPAIDPQGVEVSLNALFDTSDSEIDSQSTIQLNGNLRSRYQTLFKTLQDGGGAGHVACYLNRAKTGDASHGEVSFLFDLKNNPDRLFYGFIKTFQAGDGPTDRIKRLTIQDVDPVICHDVFDGMGRSADPRTHKCGCGTLRTWEFWLAAACQAHPDDSSATSQPATPAASFACAKG